MNNLMTAEELADYLKCKPGKIYELKAREQIPYLKINGMLRFDKDDIIKWLSCHKHNTN